MDETYVKVSGSWRYVYRAVDEIGQFVEGFHELGVEAGPGMTVPAAFDELALVI